MGIPSCEQTDTTENITFPQTAYAGDKKQLEFTT